MTTQRIFGIILLALGLCLLVVGMNSTHSWADQFSNAFTGRWTDRTTWYILSGIGTALVGLSVMVFGPRWKSV